MENDSTKAISPVPQGTQSDTALVQQPSMPTPEELGISISTPAPTSHTVGDTFDFPITVSWSVNGSAILVVPQGGVNAKGLDQVGLSQQSARAVKDGHEIATQTFNFRIVAKDSGNLNVPAVKFEIPTSMGALELRSENTPVRVGMPFNPLPLIVGIAVGLCVIIASLWRMRRKANARAQKNAVEKRQSELLEKMLILKQRVHTAESREWLLELEKVCKGYAREKYGTDQLESLEKEGKLEGWKDILEQFAQARYGAASKDSFEIRETWKAAMKLMGVEEE